MTSVRTIAIHLPQFHPIPENDLWWGKGFTEWTNVARAKPLFRGHYQPHLPADLGFYDLRLDESREAQAALAGDYGINGFCFYHYWFNGKRLLHQPVDDMLRTGKPDFPFMVCWANENWTRTWDGHRQGEILMQQTYSHQDDVSHIRFLLEHVFSDSRYIRVEDKPFFLIYRPALFPDISKTLEVWRSEALKAGLPGLYLGYMQSFNFKQDPGKIGFDCAVEFQPDFYRLPSRNMTQRIQRKLGIGSAVSKQNTIVSYKDFIEIVMKDDVALPDVYKTVCPMWDNSPRKREGATIFTDEHPGLYEKWLRHVFALTKNSDQKEKFVFINAWNEWAEGNHLEPCMKWGRKFLEATKNAVNGAV